VYCHRADGWPDDPEIVERVPVRACVRRGAAIDLVLDRARERRSQIVFTFARGREAIFWQTARTARKARPRVTAPTTRAAGASGPLTVVVDTQEKYPYRFVRQQVIAVRRRLPAGDYAVEPAAGLVAAVKRKSLPDLLGALSTGTLGYALADLATLARAAVVVEDRYARLLDGACPPRWERPSWKDRLDPECQQESRSSRGARAGVVEPSGRLRRRSRSPRW